MSSANPILTSKNRFKIGTFCTNGRGAAQTLVPEAGTLNWPMSLEAAQLADRHGFEAIVPFARWKGYVAKDPMHETGAVMDTYTWAAAIAQATSRAGVFVTTHAPTIHPLLAAKQLATIDIISGGRLGLNVVGGWNKPELDMFGAEMREHDERYDYLDEWLSIVERLWASDAAFDHHGSFFDIIEGVSLPQPIQQPRPPIMNAGGSDRGREFACKNADMCFVIIKSEDPDKIRAEVEAYKSKARDTYGRDVQVWTNAFVVQRDSAKEAEDYLEYYAVEQQDTAALDGWMKLQGAQAKLMPPEVLKTFRKRFAAGAGGFPLVGDAETIARRIAMLADCGIDGSLLTWVEYVKGIESFAADVLPILNTMGLRQ